MHYTPHVDLAFLSVEHLMRDVNYGYFLRYAHANGASAFFYCLFTLVKRFVLWVFYLSTSNFMVKWCCYSVDYDSNRVYGVCFTLRANEFLGSDGYYKFIFGYTLYWFGLSLLIMGGLFY